MTVYPSYKSSGISWIGSIPEHWSTTVIKNGYSTTLGKMLCQDKKGSTDTYENYICAANIKWNGINQAIQKQMWFTANEKKQYLLSEGDVLVMEGGLAGTACMYNSEFSPCFIQNSVHKCTAKNNNINKFLYYWLFSSYHAGYVDSICNKATIQHYTGEKLATTPIILPPSNEQNAIVQYLDNKVSHIDDLISEARASIEEYKTWKASIIYEAVTKGLDPNAEMKDSGVEWIGEIPVHWKLTTLKRICQRISDGSHFSPLQTLEGKPYVTAGDVRGKGIDYSACKTISEEDYCNLVKAGCQPSNGDILLVKDGATTGRVGLMIDDTPCVLLSSVAMLTPAKNVDSNYLMRFMESDVMQFQIRKSMAGSAMPRTTLTKLMAYTVIDCPLEEQRTIANFLDDKCTSIDSLISEKESLISDLEVYRKSLIFEVVTGKRKVV